MENHKKIDAEEKLVDERGKMNSFLCVSSVQVTVHQGKLELRLCVDQDDNECVRDLSFGRLTSSNATYMTVCTEKGDNCCDCGDDLKERTSTINFSVTALRSVCSCVFNDHQFQAVQDDFKCAKIRKIYKKGQRSLTETKHQAMEDNEALSKGDESENVETSKQMANSSLEDMHSNSTSLFVRLHDNTDTDNSKMCERENDVDCQCEGLHLENSKERSEKFASIDIVNIGKCKFCDFQYKEKSVLQSHLELKHPEEVTFRCQFCGESFSDNKSLKVHGQDHFDAQSFSGDYSDSSGVDSENKSKNQCDHCKKTFILSSELESHECDQKDLKPHMCPHCDKTFRTKDYLRKHITVHSEIKKFQCNHCSKSFSRQGDLQSHVTLHTGDKKFKCEECGKSFTTNSALKKHGLLHAKEKDFQCDICGREYASELQLKKHSKLHNMDTPFICEYCGKTFTTKHYLKSHVKTHQQYEKAKCHLCGKSYRDPAYLKVHLKSHTGEGLVKCDLCGENFADPNYLTLHKKKFCKANGVKCDKCERVFANKLDLSYHVGVHTGERPFECDICGKGFTKSDRLSCHRKRHLDSEKTHECKICHKRFVCASDVKKHQKSHSAKKKLSLPDKFKFGMSDVDQMETSKDLKLPTSEANRPPLMSVQPVVSVNQNRTGEIKHDADNNVLGVSGQKQKKSMLTKTLTQLHNNATKLHNNVTQLPKHITQFTDNETQLTDSVTISNDVIQLPQNVIHIPDSILQTSNNVTQFSDSVLHIPIKGTKLPINVTQLENNVTQFTANATQIQGNITHEPDKEMGEGIPENVSFVQGFPEIPTSGNLGPVSNTVTILQACGSKIPENLTLIQANTNKFDMPNTVTFVPGVSLIQPKVPSMTSETLMPEDVAMIQEEMSIIEENVQLDIPNQGMEALQLPDSDTLGDSLTTSMNTSEASFVEHQRLDLPEISLPEETPQDPYGTEDSNDPMKSEMLLDTASISSPIHIDSLDPNTSFENALNFEMSDSDQLLGNPYVMYKLVLPGKSPSK